VDTDHVGNLSAPVRAPGVRRARAVAVAQTGNELTAQFAARLGIDGRVNGFVRNVLGRVGRLILSAATQGQGCFGAFSLA
jgi:hypothetical protein